MNEVVEKEGIKIEKLIYEIRGVPVMLDSDLARLYECKNGTKTINQAVKRNSERFPKDFYFQLNNDEYLNLQSQFGTTKLNSMSRTLPYAFTEQGVAMLATVLRTEVASKMSVSIMRAFVAMRKYISTNLIEQKIINSIVLDNKNEIKEIKNDVKLLQESFKKFEEKRKVNEIYFDGQIFDAYFKIQEIFKRVTKELIIIDAYADNTILDIIKRLKINVIVITKSNNFLTKQDIKKYNLQYNNLKIYYDNTFHDRYFILDGNEVYHCGSSINRIGYKTFSITLIGDNEVCQSLINKVNKII